MPAPSYVDVGDVLERLRMKPGDPDADYVAACTDVANERVDDYLRPVSLVDGTTPAVLDPVPRSVWRAALGVAIRVYRFKDTEADVADTWGDAGPLRIPRDPLAGYLPLLDPYRPGVAWAPG